MVANSQLIRVRLLKSVVVAGIESPKVDDVLDLPLVDALTLLSYGDAERTSARQTNDDNPANGSKKRSKSVKKQPEPTE